ncbi:MAG: hypothetical protein JW839_11225 [Candidatus Lokiarchaeota archaeon]|nr:hypothetical protein [Candidatus Lokiarchaeota archaeon]
MAINVPIKDINSCPVKRHMVARTPDRDIKARHECTGFLLMALLVSGFFLFVIGITIMASLLIVLGLSFMIGFVVLSAWLVKMIGGWKKVTLYRRESTSVGD